MAKINPELIYGDLKDKYVAGVKVYAHTDKVLYYDEKHTTGNTVNAEEAMDYATKGLLRIVDSTGTHIPTDFSESGGTVTVTLADDTTEYTSKERTKEE